MSLMCVWLSMITYSNEMITVHVSLIDPYDIEILVLSSVFISIEQICVTKSYDLFGPTIMKLKCRCGIKRNII